MEVLVKEKINQVLKGDQNAYSTIVEEYKDKVFYLCYRMIGNRHEAEDLAQEAFVKAYIHLKSFNMNLKFSTWIYRIATNLCIDRIRKKKPDYYLDAEIAGTDGLDMYSQLASDADSPEKEAESMEMQEAVQKEILKLPEKYRSVIILKYMEDLSLKEISDALDLPVGTVKTRIHRGREALRLQLRHL
ncbi:RNA polymerase sigma factor SigW [Peribacillus sp. SCS-26]|uniref:RNA polymerase sigma factor SigW n=1 Tax=Paraperibacillus marinus TaxID=3115295 RepID=UPI003906CB45